MKLIDIKPIRYDGIGCFLNPLISIAEWAKLEYELAFTDCWGFYLLHDGIEDNSSLGNRIKSMNNDSIASNLKDYCGMDIIWNENVNANDTLDAIDKQLSNNMPLIILIDTFWCPWSVDYQRFHGAHFFAVIGIDDDFSTYCIDPTLHLDISRLPYNNFLNGIGKYATFDFSKPIEIGDYRIFIKDSIKRVLELNTFKEIRKFADVFKSDFDFPVEFADTGKTLWHNPMFHSIGQIAGSRNLYAKLVEHISSKTSCDKLLLYSNELKKAASKWKTITGLLTKAYYSTFTDAIRDRIVDLILSIADFEESIANSLYQFDYISSGTDYPAEYENCSESRKNNDIRYIDLTGFFNNNGFGSSVSQNCKANLNMDEYFLNDGLPSERIWKVNGMSFMFPEIKDDINNNVSCEEQVIKVPLGEYESIMLLGCAECGDFLADMRFNYENGDDGSLTIAFTEWSRLPKFGELEAWKGRCVQKDSKGAYILSGAEVRLCAVEYPIAKKGRIDSITLPFCPNIHIFAMSLRFNNSKMAGWRLK